ncbi:hypothetical protein I79_002316 [Cricetulus griseus]|uniref:Uncharacterized protein n=1 Tax=Cricetulus griseus TaxID=10029 RepID=G3GX81_CRIGR|nr:hypothetical protein I79_002316 [Cricetulus griseus]
MCTQAIASSALEVRGHLWQLVLSPHHVGLEDGTRSIRCSGWQAHLLNHVSHLSLPTVLGGKNKFADKETVGEPTIRSKASSTQINFT